jgi:hypothetical protein
MFQTNYLSPRASPCALVSCADKRWPGCCSCKENAKSRFLVGNLAALRMAADQIAEILGLNLDLVRQEMGKKQT